MFNDESGFVYEFNNVKMNFYITNNEEFVFFQCKQLNYLPRVGESIDLPFLRNEFGTSVFYVEEVMHKFSGDKQEIDVSLRSGIHNLYWQHRKHKALELGELSFKEMQTLSEYELKLRLGVKG